MSRVMRLLRFALVGTLCFLAQWCAVHALRQDIHPFVADVIAFALSAQLNFWLSKTITWRDRHQEGDDGLLRTWRRYNTVAIIATVLNAGVFWLSDRFVWEVIALGIAWVASAAFSFKLNHVYVFPGKAHLLLPEFHQVDLTEAGRGGIAIFMPAHNEAENLPYVVGEAVAWLHGLVVPFAVIVIDDGSTDDTAEVMNRLMQAFPEVALVSHERNQGYGAALRSGLRASLQTGYEWIAFCDSDGQFKSHDFGKLIAHAVHLDADICIGYRIDRADGLKRRLMGRGWHMVSRALLGYKAMDVDCGFKVFRRHSVVTLDRKLIGDHATISPEILARAHKAGHKIVEVGVNHYPRQHGTQSGANWSVVLGSAKGLVTVRRTIRQEARSS